MPEDEGDYADQSSDEEREIEVKAVTHINPAQREAFLEEVSQLRQ